MKVVRGVRNLEKDFTCALTIGNFDGVHAGHQKLVSKVLEFSKSMGLPSMVMTFNPHPVQVLYPERELKRLFPFEDQVEQLEKLGVDYLLIEPFSRSFSEQSPMQFLEEWLIPRLHPKALVVGYDFSFGSEKKGNTDFLKKHSNDFGYQLEVVHPHKVKDILVSSSKIRNLLFDGDTELVCSLLGRPFYVEGIVVHGEGRGRTINVPTANVESAWTLVPQMGVYSVVADISGKRVKGVCNIGTKPTFHIPGKMNSTIEVHLFDFDSDIYGKRIRVHFYKKIRNEKKFEGIDQLVRQIGKDIEVAKDSLKDV